MELFSNILWNFSLAILSPTKTSLSVLEKKNFGFRQVLDLAALIDFTVTNDYRKMEHSFEAICTQVSQPDVNDFLEDKCLQQLEQIVSTCMGLKEFLEEHNVELRTLLDVWQQFEFGLVQMYACMDQQVEQLDKVQKSLGTMGKAFSFMGGRGRGGEGKGSLFSRRSTSASSDHPTTLGGAPGAPENNHKKKTSSSSIFGNPVLGKKTSSKVGPGSPDDDDDEEDGGGGPMAIAGEISGSLEASHELSAEVSGALGIENPVDEFAANAAEQIGDSAVGDAAEEVTGVEKKIACVY